jgi:hypothetical protein
MKWLNFFVGILLANSLAASGRAEQPAARFTRKPTATTSGTKVTIEFAVDRETDVAVFIENARGEIVRHLVAGVLGKNPPSPLKAGRLAQSIEWDGKADSGKQGQGGPFRARVALGLGARYDRVVLREPENIGAVNSLGVGPDGTLYVVYTFANVGPGWTGQGMVAFNRDGTYQRMIQPFPSDLKAEQVKGVGVAEIAGRPAPLIKAIGGRHLYSGTGLWRSGLAVTREGQILYPLRDLRLGALDRNGATPWGDFAGPLLFGKSLWTQQGQRVFLAVSSDDNYAYMTGLGHCSQTVSAAKLDNPYPAVFKVKLPERGPAEVFFGERKATGNDQTHFGGLPSGVAVDGKGNILVGDPANKRVVVISEKDGKFVGSFAMESPDCLATDPATGAIYVTRLTGGAVELVKFSGWKDGKLVAKLPLPRDIEHEHPWLVAADVSAKPPVLWLGGGFGDRCRLLRVEDLGEKFGEIRRINTDRFGSLSLLDLCVERVGKMVYAKAGGYVRYEEETDKLSALSVQAYHPAHMIAPAPNGSLFTLSWSEPGMLRRVDRHGKPTAAPGKGDIPVLVGMNITPHTLGVRPSDGHAFVFEPAPPGKASGGRTNKRLIEFGPDGKRIEGLPLIWCVSDVVIGPKFDPQGNIYIADQVRPAGQPAVKGLGNVADGLYGSIIKFAPAVSIKGGRIHWPTPTNHLADSGLPKPKADPSLRTIEAVSIDSYDKKSISAQVIGAEWMHFGYSHVEVAYCNCESTRFDVDDFGRVFYPDMARFRVGVLDTNGNTILHFGGYGNADSMGPDSPVLDPKTKKVRPRRADDPRDLKSPFASPDIAFCWLNGVGITDRYAYMTDILNRRILRARLVYSAEETCALK